MTTLSAPSLYKDIVKGLSLIAGALVLCFRHYIVHMRRCFLFKKSPGKPSDQTIKSLTWIVQNNAVGDDKHHNWYVGQHNNSRTYENQTAYSGSHTLLCEVRNQRGRIVATKAIKVDVGS